MNRSFIPVADEPDCAPSSIREPIARQINRSEKRFRWVAAAIVILSVLLRLFYVFDAHVVNPIVGDVNQYVLYAWNLNHGGTFSSSLPDGEPVTPDSYRGPGYPVLIAAAMRASGNGELWLRDTGEGRRQLVAMASGWITLVYLVQAVFGALTVLLVIAIARLWMPRGAALCAAGLTALWPHLISFTGAILSETLFGFLLALALWLLLGAQNRDRAWIATCAGLTFGVAWLVNPVVALFPLLAAGAFVAARRSTLAIALIVAYLILPLGWTLRSAMLPTSSNGSERAAQNFVQGSWPDYLAAYNDQHANPIAQAIVLSEAEEERVFIANRHDGVALMAQRMSREPRRYLAWYLARKPFLLWDWGVRIGWGDIYFPATTKSPFADVPLLGWLKNVVEFFNPIIFALAFGATIVAIGQFVRRPQRDSFAPGIVALFLFYLTVVHSVLQAEPRYSVPYRPEEILMVIFAIASVCKWVVGRTRQNQPPSA